MRNHLPLFTIERNRRIMKYRSRHFNIPCSSLRREKNNGNNISTSRVIGIVCASYLDSLWYATVNTAIIYSYHGLLSVRYVALYDRIERQWHVFVQKCKRFDKHFPWKMPGRCPGTSFLKKMYHVRLRVGQHCLYSCQNILFRSVDYFDISFRGVNELSILFDGVNELSIIFDGINKLNILFHGVNELHISFPSVNELNILFLA